MSNWGYWIDRISVLIGVLISGSLSDYTDEEYREGVVRADTRGC